MSRVIRTDDRRPFTACVLRRAGYAPHGVALRSNGTHWSHFPCRHVLRNVKVLHVEDETATVVATIPALRNARSVYVISRADLLAVG